MRRFAKAWILVFGPLAVVALLVPVAAGDPAAAQRGMRQRLAADTLRTSQRVRQAEAALALAESLHTARISDPRPAAVVRPAPGEGVPRRAVDPTIASLAAAIQEARRLRTVDAWLAVSAQSPVSGGPRMRRLADSLSDLARERDALLPGPDRDQRAAPLTSAMSRVGYTILAIAENRRATLAAENGPAMPDEGQARGDSPDMTAATAAAAVAADDTLASASRLRMARDSLTTIRRSHAEAIAVATAMTDAPVAAPSITLATLAPSLALFVVLIGGLTARFAFAYRAESAAPTIAHADEAERTVGASVLATVRDAPLDGPARFRPSGVDPFRMLYLGLTATGTRARTMIVTGSDPEIVAAVGTRLAISAAADHRATLVIDLDPVSIALSRTLRERAEPGLNDALAGAFKWREVARPVGSSDGLPITMIPAGTERDLPIGPELESRRDDLNKFRAAFEFTILIVPEGHLELGLSLVETSPLVLCAAVGETLLSTFADEGSALRRGGRRLHGIVLWDAPRPSLPTRAELAAMLSVRRGRTPGGSFAAVQRAISAADKRQ